MKSEIEVIYGPGSGPAPEGYSSVVLSLSGDLCLVDNAPGRRARIEISTSIPLDGDPERRTLEAAIAVLRGGLQHLEWLREEPL